jgi:hypothetical protein
MLAMDIVHSVSYGPMLVPSDPAFTNVKDVKRTDQSSMDLQLSP